jgi:hypothetical protein
LCASIQRLRQFGRRLPVNLGDGRVAGRTFG